MASSQLHKAKNKNTADIRATHLVGDDGWLVGTEGGVAFVADMTDNWERVRKE